MKTMLLAALLFATPALADTSDDYAACLIGRAAVAIKDGAKDAESAMKVAHSKCNEPQGLNTEEGEGISDFANSVVLDIAD